MNVCVATPVFWPEVRRGAERLSFELAAALRDRGHDAWLLTSHRARLTDDHEGAVPVKRIWRPPGDARLERRWFEPFLTSAPGMAHAAKQSAADIVHAVQPATAAAVARHRPTVFAYMGIPHRAAIANRRGRLTAILQATERAQATTALSTHCADAFAYHLGVDARVIHPPVDTDAFRPGPARTEHPTIVFAGAIAEPRKRFALAVEAMRIVRRSQPHATLLADRAPTDIDGVASVDLDDRTTLAHTYATAHASLLPSWGEAFGLVLAEALACGTPAVGANLGGIPEVLGDDPHAVGGLFDGDDPHDLAQAILHALELAKDPATTQNCRAQGEQFSAARCAAAHEALYNEI